MGQTNKTCPICGELGHSKFYCTKKPIKPIKRSPLKAPRPTPATKTAPVKKKKTESRGQLVRKLDNVFSQYVRLKNAKDGMAVCVTCGAVKPWKEMQNAHFYTRARYPTRWSEDNCHVGCYRCNVILSGNYIVYTKYMLDRYGREFVDELERTSNSGIKISTPEIRERITLYTQKVRGMLQ